MTGAGTANVYDEVLYVGDPFPQTHPDRLATIARLFGLDPAPVASCRVLELGCADGGNLIPMAYELPGSQCVGIDSAALGIAHGQATCAQLGLTNISLLQLNMMEPLDALGDFDYIIAHGVYSWVPPEVQPRVLEICRRHLRPQGVAYISYNTYPGAHLRMMIAEMMKYHARRFDAAEEQIRQARAMVALLGAGSSGGAGYRAFLEEELESIAVRRADNLFHDELATYNSPVYFHDFMREAASHGLQYLGEADFFEMHDFTQSPEVAEATRRLQSDVIGKEQYMDFLKCRRFRQTLLCHEEIAIHRRLDASRMRSFGASAAPGLAQTPGDGLPSTSNIAGLDLRHPAAQGALGLLAESWPRVWSFDDLVSAVHERAGSPEEAGVIGNVLLGCYAAGIVELHVQAPRFVLEVSARPLASAVARLQARTQSVVTNLRHDSIHLDDDLGRALLTALDGQRDRAELVAYLVTLFDAEGVRSKIEAGLEASLQKLARCALLEG